MEQNIVINIGMWQFLVIIVGLIGIAFKTGILINKINNVEVRMERLEGKVNNSMVDRSPLALTDKGEKILKRSGLKEYINANKDSLIKKVNPEKLSPYDIQEKAADVMRNHLFGTTEITIKTAAYLFGVDVSVVKRIGSLYLRDLCLKKIGINPKEKIK